MLVLVLKSGSSSVKFALLDPGSGRRVVAGLTENVGTAEAVLHVRREEADPVTERLEDGTYTAVISRIVEYLPEAGPGQAWPTRRGWPASATGWCTGARVLLAFSR